MARTASATTLVDACTSRHCDSSNSSKSFSRSVQNIGGSAAPEDSPRRRVPTSTSAGSQFRAGLHPAFLPEVPLSLVVCSLGRSSLPSSPAMYPYFTLTCRHMRSWALLRRPPPRQPEQCIRPQARGATKGLCKALFRGTAGKYGWPQE